MLRGHRPLVPGDIITHGNELRVSDYSGGSVSSSPVQYK
jgi:hypothetical protein